MSNTVVIHPIPDPVEEDLVQPITEEEPEKKDEDTKTNANQMPDMVTFGELFRFATGSDKMLILVGALGAIVAGGLLPGFSLVFGEMMNTIKEDGSNFMDKIVDLALVFIYMGIAAFFCAFLELACFMRAAENQAYKLRVAYMNSLIRQEISWHDLQKTGDLTIKLTEETRKFQEGIGEKLGQVFHHNGTFFTGIVIAFVKGWQLTLVILAVAPLLMMCGFFFGKILAEFNNNEQGAYAEAGAIANDYVTGLRTVASFQAESSALLKYSNPLQVAYAAGVKKARSMGIALGGLLFVMFGAYGFALWYGSTLIRDGVRTWPDQGIYTGGDVLAIFLSIIMGAMGLGQVGPSIGSLITARVSLKPLLGTIDRVPTIDPLDESHGTKIDHTIQGKIELKNVKFTYPARQEVQVLNDLSITFAAGTTVALVGSSGCGKSTIIQLIERFYDPNEGNVMIDDVYNLRDLNIRSWRQNVGLVAQEPVLFQGTIADNIRYGKEDASMAEIEAAAKDANAHGFILKLPKGYDTMVGEAGRMLSGGQKQRIAIARALIKNPRILLLDEATSALDTNSERIVQRALDKLLSDKSQRRTTIVIAHRLSTIKNADRILVLDKGSVVEDGTHTSLIAQGGVYASLVMAQEGTEKVEEEQVEVKEEEDEEILVVPEIDTNTTHDIQLEPLTKQPSTTHSTVHPVTPGTTDSTTKDKSSTEVKQEEVSNEPLHVPMSRIFELNKGERMYIALGILGAAMDGVIFPLYALIFGGMSAAFYENDVNKMQKLTEEYAVYFVCLGIGAFISQVLANGMLGVAGERLTMKIRSLVLEKIMSMHMAWHDEDKHSPTLLVVRLATDATLVQNITNRRLQQAVTVLANLVTGLTIAFVKGWKLALVTLAVFPIIAVGGYIEMQFMAGFGFKGKDALEKAGQLASEGVGSIRTVNSFNGERALLSVFTKHVHEIAKTGGRGANAAGVGFGISQMVIYMAYALCFWYGGKLVSDGELNLGEMLQVFFALLMSAMSLGQAMQFAPDMDKARAATNSIFNILDSTSLIDYRSKEGVLVDTKKGEVELKNVFFSYPTRPKMSVLKGVSIKADAGKVLAIIGESGSGKSTIMSLLQRFYDPSLPINDDETVQEANSNDIEQPKLNPGQIFIDGIDIATMRVSELRSYFGVVSQEPILFSGTLADNIRFGNPDLSMDEVIEAAKLANIHDFIMTRLPKQYETMIGSKGTQLSGGQKQRIAIARAIARNPRILLLDEATSALDSTSEALVQRALDAAMKGRTTIVVAHRLSTIRNADKIVVMGEGRVLEGPGNHDDLMALNGMYANLVAAAALLPLNGSNSNAAITNM